MLDLAYPNCCVACGESTHGSLLRHLCTRCAGRVELVGDPCCRDCGHPFLQEETVGFCPHCAGWKADYEEARVVVMAKGPVRALVHELKYHQGRYVLGDIERLLRANPEVLDWARGSILVPVPLHPARERARGYNQSRLIARRLAVAAGGATRVHDVLCRVAYTHTQTAFDRQTRRTNLKNAFALAPGAVITAQHSYLLVDDVLTTGSTLSSCARVLRQAGCLNVRVIAFGHG
ncbi:MAG: ComF family protein [Opitutaceae bacterium]|nr:ComF family protein [Opitutaceae bacterium]